jgi:hypothetical protein
MEVMVGCFVSDTHEVYEHTHLVVTFNVVIKVPLQSHGYILPHLASDSMCSQPFCTEQKMKEPWDGSILRRMTYCVEHPTRKMLLVPVEPAEPNLHCYVCSEVFSSI